MKNWNYIEGAKTGNICSGNKNPDWNVGNYDWDVGIFNGQWYITKNGQKFKGPFRSMQEAARYLDGHKWEFEYKLENSKTGNADLSAISKNWSKTEIDHILQNAHMFKKEVVEEAKRLKEAEKQKTGNEEKTGAEEFFKKLSDDVKEREEKDDADIGKVGNAKDKNGKELRVGDIVLVWTSAGERAGKVKAISGDRITVAIRNEGDWSTPGKLADKVSNSKTGNARYTTKEDVISHLDTDLYDICKKVPSGSPSFAYISELQKKGWDMNTISKYSKEIGKIIDQYKVGNKGMWNSSKTMYAKWDDKNGRPADEYAVVTWLGEGKGGLVNVWKGHQMTSEKFGSYDKNELYRWAERRIGNSAYDDGAKKGKEDKRKGKLITAAGFEYHAPGYSSLSFKEKEEYKKGYYSTNDLKKEDIYKWGNSAQDDKFAYVMREFDEGKLKTPDGKVVTDPAQAKAIAYSESKKTENGLARARNAMNKKCGNSQVTLWKGNDSVLISEDGTVQYLESNSFETDRDKYGSMQEAIDDLTKKGYRKK